MSDLEFDEHALLEMAKDVVSDDQVYHVIGDADEMIERTDGRTEYSRMLEDGRWVVVIVEHDPGIIWTVWWDKRRSRRRRQ